MHVLHAIHDFLPRHRAGSEIYALELARAQLGRHDVTVLCADYDLNREHGQVVWRIQDDVPVVELINNWRCSSFADTYRSALMTDRIRHVLQTLRPDVVHVHNLLNLSFDLPACARELGIPVVATLHDYTLVCASGGQRVHRRDQHICHDVEPARCARCFAESPFVAQMAVSRVTRGPRSAAFVGGTAKAVRRLLPGIATRAAAAVRQVGALAVTARDIEARLEYARTVFPNVDVFLAPSESIARDYRRFGLPPDRIRVSRNGQRRLVNESRPPASTPVRIGFVGTLVWHKGVHVLIDALKSLPAGSFRALIFGATEVFPDYVADLKRMAAGLPVEFKGGFDTESTEDVYRQIDVLVVPSVWLENAPLVINEAFMSGVPVVGARIGGIPELVQDEVDGLLFESGSSADLGRVLRRLVDQPLFVDELAAAAPPVKTVEANAVELDALYCGLIRVEARPA